MNNLTWQALLIKYDEKTSIGSILLQTTGGRLYPFTLYKPTKHTIGNKIADMFGLTHDRVEYHSEPRRRDQATVFNYLVMYDEMPVGIDIESGNVYGN